MAASTACRCSRPMAIGVRSQVLYTHAPTHSTSTGQTRAHEYPSRLADRITRAEPRRLPVPILRMNVGMSMPVGQAWTHGASWQ